MLPLIFVVACAPSAKDKTEAKELMTNVRVAVDSLLQSESAFVSNLRYIVKEMQVPGLEKDKKRAHILLDSCSQMSPNMLQLENAIEIAKESMEGLSEKNSDFPIVAGAQKLIEAYRSAFTNYYKPMGEELTELELPVENNTYTDIMMMCFEVDSVLNSANEQFNIVSFDFIKHYDIKVE